MTELGAPIYERTAWDHGFAPKPRPLGAVRAPLVPTDADLLASIARIPPEFGADGDCRRCGDGRGDALCRACEDEVSHAAEERRYREAAASLADDEWGE